jgi:elongation factor Ts
MANISAEEIAKLRVKTGSGMMDCKKALEEANGDEDKAIDILRKNGALKATKKAGRVAKEGVIESYVHANGRIGVLVEVSCETDFVAKNKEFQEFAHEVALHIAAMSPKYVSHNDVPKEESDKEKNFLLDEIKKSGKPADIAEKIVTGKMDKYYEEICLLEQPFIKNQDHKIIDLLNEKIAKIGEKIEIRRFCRFEIGE